MRYLLSLMLILSSFAWSYSQTGQQLARAAFELTKQDVEYDPSYFSMD